MSSEAELLSPWWPSHAPIFDPARTWRENIEKGPVFTAPLPKRRWPEESCWIDFLGHKVASRLGVPAGPLLDARWVALAGQLGFDIPVYKTIRSFAHNAHPLPNVLYVDTKDGLLGSITNEAVRVAARKPLRIEDISITNSFGNPSQSPKVLIADIDKAKRALSKGQVLVVSVFGTEHGGIGLVEDFVKAAQLAKTAGALILEANLSCPNVKASEGALYQSPEEVYRLARALTENLQGIPLILKMGVFPSKEAMRAVFLAAARGGAQAIAGINTLNRQVVNGQGAFALGPTRPTGGICGSGIRQAGLAWTQQARCIIEEEKLAMTLVAMGGVVLPEHFNDYLESGADIVMTATGMMWDPYLAARYHQKNVER